MLTGREICLCSSISSGRRGGSWKNRRPIWQGALSGLGGQRFRIISCNAGPPLDYAYGLGLWNLNFTWAGTFSATNISAWAIPGHRSLQPRHNLFFWFWTRPWDRTSIEFRWSWSHNRWNSFLQIFSSPSTMNSHWFCSLPTPPSSHLASRTSAWCNLPRLLSSNFQTEDQPSRIAVARLSNCCSVLYHLSLCGSAALFYRFGLSCWGRSCSAAGAFYVVFSF